uniref:Uncharacterized protein LOC108052912 n=1 Tax=Drosophila rhopaloa TaxID=1041015 RepID=A0A6P4FTI0_DRORH
MDEEVITVDESPADEINPLILNAGKKRATESDKDVSTNPFNRILGPGQDHILLSCATERQLIALVRREPSLYDTRHPKFKDDVHREKLWQRIAHHLDTDLTNCLVAWAELRYRFQRHVRCLRSFHRSAAQCKTPLRRRPRIRHEEELLFLYPHVAIYPVMVEKIQPTEAAESNPETETMAEVEFVEPPPLDIIDVDLEEESAYNYRCTNEHRRLIEAVRPYPQLYDPQYPGYENSRHRGLIWGAISNELHDKATKLMKSWLKLVTRYEWELWHRPDQCSSSELCQLMDFLRTHVLRLRGTVCKASKYLQSDWHEPIEHFRSVMSLINTMRNMPDLVQLTDDWLTFKLKPPRYDEFWKKVGREVMCSYERCEVTWLVLRSFHNELQAMRLAGYQLQDKWYFENALSSIFKQIASRTPRRGYKRPHNGAVMQVGEPTPSVARLPLAIVYPPASKGSSSITTSSSTTSSSTTSSSNTTSSSGTNTGPIISNIRNSSGPAIATPTSLSSSVASESSVPSFVIPKITSAISVASASIVPIKLPPIVGISPRTAAPANMVPVKLPHSVGLAQMTKAALGIGLGPIPASIQLAASNATPGAVRPIPQRPGLQVTVRPKQRVPNILPIAPPLSGAVIRAVNLPNQNPIPQTATGQPMQRPVQPSTLGALLSEPPLVPQNSKPVPQNPLSLLKPAPVQPTLVTKIPSNTVSSSSISSATGTPMVRIHQPGLSSGWDAVQNGSPAGKCGATLAPAAAAATIASREDPTIVKATAATSKWISSITLADLNKKYRPIAPAPPGIVRASKPAAEPTPTTLTHPATVGTVPATLDSSARLPTLATATAATSAASETVDTADTEVIAISDAPREATVAAPTATIPTVATVANVKAVTNAKTAAKPTAISVSQPDKEPTTSGSIQSEICADEIMVHLELSAATGNLLHIWGGNLATRYNLNMVRTATLIREVMAVPQLHKKDPQLTEKSNEIWKVIGKKFHMPEEALRACWNYLADNMSVFPLIAPMSELMRPFKGSMKVWEKSHRLFSKFDEIARKYMWMEHKDVLPDVIRHFRKHEHLYWELQKPRPGEMAPAPRQYTDQERQEVWREARVKFPNLNHRDIWSMFKFAFRTYMEDLERGIENPWPQNWWQALEQLRFLAYVRYHPLEPYYYIVHNKISEEVKRCSMYEALMSADPADKSRPTPISLLARLSKEPMPWETEEAKRMLTGQLSRPSSSAAAFALNINAQAPAPTDSPVPVPDNNPVPPKAPASEPIAGKQAPKEKEQLANGTDTGQELVPQTNRITSILPTIEAFQLTQVLRRHPHTFERASTIDKRTA